MILEIDPRSKETPSTQIRASVTRSIAAGELHPGVRLPTIRQLAGDLGLATNTIAKAYRDLEGDGLVASHGRRGTVVCEPDRADLSSLARQAAGDFVAYTRELGLDASATIRLLSEALSH